MSNAKGGANILDPLDLNSTKKPARYDDLSNIRKQLLDNQRASPVNQVSGMDFGTLANEAEGNKKSSNNVLSPTSNAENNLDVI